jgi:hypothetical protein
MSLSKGNGKPSWPIAFSALLFCWKNWSNSKDAILGRHPVLVTSSVSLPSKAMWKCVSRRHRLNNCVICFSGLLGRCLEVFIWNINSTGLSKFKRVYQFKNIVLCVLVFF